jgi:hypothetical protein
MKSKAITVESYLRVLLQDRREAIICLPDTVRRCRWE